MTKIAVIGAGIMGTNHVRVLSSLPGAELIAVVDSDRDRGEATANNAGATYLESPSDLVGLVDAAVIATPSETHASIGVPLLESGIDLLVEKPIASETSDAQRLVDAAEAQNRILMVGHIEQFNPAVLELKRIVDNPLHLELTRVGPFSPRVSTDVVLDLMIHDLDLVSSLAGSEVLRVAASGRSVVTDELDLASALITFTNGVTATLTASRVAQMKIRQIEVTQKDTFVNVDLVRQDVTIHRLHHNEFLSEGGQVYRQSGLVEIPFLEHRGEPLALELRHFLECTQGGTAPAVGGRAALSALELALEVRTQALAGLP